MIERSERDGVVVLRMRHGKVNALDAEFAAELADVVEGLAASEQRAAVLTGQDGVFSAGVDLLRVLDGGPAYLEKFIPPLSRAFRALFAVPRPLVAAVNGHAIAGGCVLAAACDLRVMAEGAGRIGVPELQVGVPFPTIALEIMRFALPAPEFQSAVLTGVTHPPAAALRRGFVDELVEPRRLLERACELARELASIPADSFRIAKREIRGPALERVDRHGPEADREVAAAWRDPVTLEAMRRYVERTLGKR